MSTLRGKGYFGPPVKASKLRPPGSYRVNPRKPGDQLPPGPWAGGPVQPRQAPGSGIGRVDPNHPGTVGSAGPWSTGPVQPQGLPHASPGPGQAPGSTGGPGGAGPIPAAMPWDTAYESGAAAVRQHMADLLAAYTANVNQTNLDYGYTGNVDPETGALSNVAVDPNNPFSRQSLLQRQIDIARKSTNTSMAARGQLYSGALQNAQDTNASNALQQENGLQQGYAGALQQLINARRQGLTQGQADLASLEGQRLDRAQQDAYQQALQGLLTGNGPAAPPAGAPAPAAKKPPPKPTNSKPPKPTPRPEDPGLRGGTVTDPFATPKVAGKPKSQRPTSRRGR